MHDIAEKYNKIICPAMAGLGGVLLALCLVFEQLFILQWVALAPAAAILMKKCCDGISKRRAYLCGLFFFEIYYLVIFHWFLYMYPLGFLGLSSWESIVVVIAGWIGLSLLQALYSALFVVGFSVAVKNETVKKYKWLMPISAAAMWVVMEWSMNLTFAGVPWSRLAMGQISVPIVQSASLFGSYFVTFLIVFVNFLIAYGFVFNKKIVFAVSLGLFAVNLAIGSMITALYKPQPTVTVAAIQGNVSSDDKWNDDMIMFTLDEYAELVEYAKAEGAELALFSETAVPYTIDGENMLSGILSDMAREAEIELLMGAFTEKNGRDYNSVIYFDKNGNMSNDVYSKRRLVPFGEFVPFESLIKVLIPPLSDINAFSASLAPGKGGQIIRTDICNIGALICFDSIYDELARESVKDGAQLLVVSTNDSWFSDSAALRMHQNQARLRAIETRRSVIRAANTGISSVITPIGEIQESLEALEKGIVVGEVEIRSDTTLYTKTGNLFVLLCGVYYVFILITAYKKKIRLRH